MLLWAQAKVPEKNTYPRQSTQILAWSSTEVSIYTYIIQSVFDGYDASIVILDIFYLVFLSFFLSFVYIIFYKQDGQSFICDIKWHIYTLKTNMKFLFLITLNKKMAHYKESNFKKILLQKKYLNKFQTLCDTYT